MWLLCRLISTYDQIPDIFFYIISMKCGRHSYLCNVPQWQWVTRNVCFHRLGNWTVKMSLLFYFAFVCYECSQGFIMPLEAGNPGPPALTDTPGVGFFPLKASCSVDRKILHPTVVSQPLFRRNLLILKLMWQFVVNRVEQIFRCMFMSGSNDGGSCAN